MGLAARAGRHKPPQPDRVRGTVLRAQSICSTNLARSCQQQQQQLQWYTVSMHPHKGTVGLRPIPPCVRASGLCTTDGARASQRQQQQQQQQRLVRRRVVSPPHNLRARKLHSSLLKNINEPRSSSVGEKQRSHVAGITSAHRRGETTPLHGMRMSFSELGAIYTHRKAALTFTC